MATEVHQFTASIPANTAKTSLYTYSIALPSLTIERIDLQVPPGPSGLMGFYLALSGQQWLPWESGQYLVWDNHTESWPLDDQPQGTGWQVVGYNLDIANAHSVVVRFHTSPVGSTVTIPPTPTVTIVTQPIGNLVTL